MISMLGKFAVLCASQISDLTSKLAIFLIDLAGMRTNEIKANDAIANTDV
ncbi:hypothetical protein H6S82_04080 [Planktothrix sp. FACHB-1355]|nr:MULTISPECIES: hypothetical protein [Oscillatoriales]MBD3558036.1 hypothetical protein [Planktothrix sp. FACHB-1355]